MSFKEESEREREGESERSNHAGGGSRLSSFGRATTN